MKHKFFISRTISRGAGFTLIELMITVVIVAILASIALPSYRDYVIRGKIPQATTKLSAARAQLEQYYQDNRTYVGACTAGTVAPLPAADDDFVYTCPTLTATAFTVTATGQGAMAGFVYTIDQSDARATTAVPDSKWGTAPASCWIVKKGGGC
ncbi:MAG TPA: type IV pilin protein [Burkholderiaceae bacterium]|nr:type IV pilin protein [Burkholderiaceae bacterium]